MPKLNKAEIENLIEDLIMTPKETHDYSMADRIYSYLKSFSRAQQIAIFQDIIGHITELGFIAKGSLSARAVNKFGLNHPPYIVEIKKVMQSGKAQNGKEKVSREKRAELILDIILNTSPQAKADREALASARNSPLTSSDTDTSTEDDATIEPEDLQYQDDLEPTPEQIAEFNKKAMKAYKDVIIKLNVYCDFLLQKLDMYPSYAEFHQTHIDTIQTGLQFALEELDPAKEYNFLALQSLPVEIKNLKSYFDTLLDMEIKIDDKVQHTSSFQEYVDRKTAAAQQSTSKVTKNNYSCAMGVIDALSKFIEILQNIKQKFAALFSKTNSPVKKSPEDEKYMEAQKNLMLFYNETKDGMGESIIKVKEQISRLQNLPTPKN